MQWAHRLLGVGLAGLMVMATAVPTIALFRAPAPGAELKPVGGAESVIDLIQGRETLLWSSITGNVTSYTVFGWPSSIAEHNLGGAMVIERPRIGSAGVIDFGEKPMSVQFDVAG